MDLTCILQVSSFNRVSWGRIFLVFFSYCKKMPVEFLELCPDHFIVRLSQSLIHKSNRHHVDWAKNLSLCVAQIKYKWTNTWIHLYLPKASRKQIWDRWELCNNLEYPKIELVYLPECGPSGRLLWYGDEHSTPDQSSNFEGKWCSTMGQDVPALTQKRCLRCELTVIQSLCQSSSVRDVNVVRNLCSLKPQPCYPARGGHSRIDLT
jgi:hypothetical protein